MHEQTSDPYLLLLTEWQARREVVNVYHRALRFLTPFSANAPERQRDLNGKLVIALIAFRQASEQLRRYEPGHAASDPR
jgi:hypothetical protein